MVPTTAVLAHAQTTYRNRFRGAYAPHRSRPMPPYRPSTAKLSASRTGPHDVADPLAVRGLEHAELLVVSVSPTPSMAGGQHSCSDNGRLDEETSTSSGPRLHVVETEIASDRIPVGAFCMDRIVPPPHEVAQSVKQSDRHTRIGSCVELGESRRCAPLDHDIAHGRSARNRPQYRIIRQIFLLISGYAAKDAS